MVQVSCIFAPDAGTGRPSHACQHAQPGPDPVSHNVHHIFAQVTRKRGELVSSGPGRASVPSSSSSSAFKVFAAAPGALVLACVIVRLSVAALGARMRSPAHSCVRPHPRISPAGSSRKLRSRKFDVKFKSGLFPEFQVRLIRP